MKGSVCNTHVWRVLKDELEQPSGKGNRHTGNSGIILGGQTSPTGILKVGHKIKNPEKGCFFPPFLDLFKDPLAWAHMAGVQHTAAAAAVHLQ